MENEVVIRRFKEEDLEGLIEMINTSFETPALDLVYEDEIKDFWLSEYTKENLLDIATNRHLYIALIDGKVVGSGAVNEDSGMAYISAVFINPNIQGKGIGTKMMNALEKDEICQRFKKVFLTAALSAGKFYQKLGYTYKYEVPEIVLDGCLDVVYMEKDLD